MSWGAPFRTNRWREKKLLCATRLYNESNYSKAIKYLRQLLDEAESPRDAVPVLLFAALCYTDAGVYDQAIQIYYDLLEHDPKHAQAHSNLGFLYAAQGDYEMAHKHYNKSIESSPKNYYAYVNRANCYFNQHDFDHAICDAKQALEVKNNGHEASSLLAIIYALEGDAENKEKYFHMSVATGKNAEELKEAINYYMTEKESSEEAQTDLV